MPSKTVQREWFESWVSRRSAKVILNEDGDDYQLLLGDVEYDYNTFRSEMYERAKKDKVKFRYGLLQDELDDWIAEQQSLQQSAGIDLKQVKPTIRCTCGAVPTDTYSNSAEFAKFILRANGIKVEFDATTNGPLVVQNGKRKTIDLVLDIAVSMHGQIKPEFGIEELKSSIKVLINDLADRTPQLEAVG